MSMVPGVADAQRTWQRHVWHSKAASGRAGHVGAGRQSAHPIPRSGSRHPAAHSLPAQIGTLDTRKRDLENRVVELRHKVEVIEKRENERRLLDEKRRKEELEFLKYQGQHFDQFLKSIGGSGK